MPFKAIPPLYGTWQNMIQRCTNQNHPQWKWYGGRGITVCQRWHDYHAFFTDMSPKPPRHWLDRQDNNGNYEPNNCRWATPKEQNRNQSRTRFVMIEGTRYCAADLADEIGIKTTTLVARAAAGLTYAEITDPTHRRHEISHADNQRGLAIRAANYRNRTHCKYGHAMTPEGRLKNHYGGWQCRECRRLSAERQNKKRRQHRS